MKIAKNALFVTLLMACFAIQVNATTHTILFGGASGLHYVPQTLTVALGDTIVWSGEFGSHPLASTTIPATAPTFGATTGSTFSYVVSVMGDYNYKCVAHVNQGMVGSFTAAPASVKSTAPNTISLSSYPNPSVKSVAFHFVLPESANVMMKLYDIKGNLVADVLNEYRASGTNEASFNTTALAAGTYICKFSAGVYQSAQEIVVVK